MVQLAVTQAAIRMTDQDLRSFQQLQQQQTRKNEQDLPSRDRGTPEVEGQDKGTTELSERKLRDLANLQSILVVLQIDELASVVVVTAWYSSL